MTKRDISLIVVSLLIFVSFFFIFNNKADVRSAEALIVYKDQVLSKIDLSKDNEYCFGISKKDFKPEFYERKDFKTEAYSAFNIIQVEQGRVRVKEASCPDKLCAQMQPISREEEMIVCLPHKFYIKLSGQKEGGLDAISE